MKAVTVELQAAGLETVADDIAGVLRNCLLLSSGKGTGIPSESVLNRSNAFAVDFRFFLGVLTIKTRANI